MYLPVSGFEPMSSVFLGECVTRWSTVADVKIPHQGTSCIMEDMHPERGLLVEEF